MTDDSKNFFWCKAFIIPNIIGIFLMITPLYIPSVPHWIAGIIFWGSFLILVGILLLHIRDCYKLPLLKFLPFGKISLPKAALIAYEESRGTMHGTAAEITCKDNPLQYFANALAEEGRVWGRHPPSRKLEEINKNEMGHIREGGKYTTVNDMKTIVYIDLQIEKSHLRKYIKEVKKLKYANS